MAYPFPKQGLATLGGNGGGMDGHQGWGLTFSTSPLSTCLAQKSLRSLPPFNHIHIPPTIKINKYINNKVHSNYKLPCMVPGYTSPVA